MKKRNHIQNLKTVLNTTGLGVFLTVGLSGCDGIDNNDDCKQYSNLSKQNIEECRERKNTTHSSGGAVHSSGFFGSSSSSHGESIGG